MDVEFEGKTYHKSSQFYIKRVKKPVEEFLKKYGISWNILSNFLL